MKVMNLCLLIVICIGLGCASVGKEWKRVSDIDTVETYEQFLSEYPDCEFSDRAKICIEAKHYDSAIRQGSIEAYKSFLEKHPNGKYAKETKNALVKQEFENACTSAFDIGSSLPLEEFVNTHPNGFYTYEARDLITALEEVGQFDQEDIDYVGQFDLSKKSTLDIISSDDLVRLEQIYLQDHIAPNGDTAALALTFLEWKLGTMLSDADIHLPPVGEFSDFGSETRYTLTALPQKDVYEASCVAYDDEVKLTEFYPLPPSSIIRFKGRVPFPLKRSPGQLDGGVLARGSLEDIIRFGVTNSTLIQAPPILKHYLFEGSQEDPLTFVLVKGRGYYYLHGTGKVTLPSGIVKSFPQ